MSYIIKVSPKGQITIPVSERKNCKHKQYLFEVKGKTIILKPIEITIIENEKHDEMENFSSLADPSFEFWNNDQDDIYDSFYNKK